MPSAFEAGNELNQLTVAANKEMRRDSKIFNGLIIGMIGRIKTVIEERDYSRSAKFTRRQRNVMYHQKIDAGAFRPFIEIRRTNQPRPADEPTGINRKRTSLNFPHLAPNP